MKYTHKILFSILLGCSAVFAQANPHQRLHDAFVLEQQGRFSETIAEAKSAIDSNQLDEVELGRASIALGVAYHEEGRFTEAQVAFELSLRILAENPEHASDYAAALENYAGLYSDTGQLALAGPMWMKALQIRQQAGDHAAAGRSLTNLAGLHLAQKQLREAKDYLNRASAEMKLAHDVIDDDFAVFFETEAWLALSEGNVSAAIDKYQRALEICRSSRGEQHWLTGWEYMLRGNAYAQSGDTSRALADMREGLAILDRTLGRQNSKYFLAQIAYSQVLDQIGSHAEAARLRAAAQQASKDFYRGQCVGCTINVTAFR